MTTVRTAELCIGQRYIWYSHHSVPPEARQDAHIPLEYPLPEGITLAGLRSALNYLVRRHEALRTTIAFAGPTQRVAAPGPLPIEVVTTEQDGTAAPAEVIGRMNHTEFDMEHEWPMRACVVTTGGVPKRLVLVLNHVAFDNWGIDTLKREFQALLTAILARKPASLPPVGIQPADLAKHETAQRATQLQDLEYWRKQIAELPADMFAYRRRHQLDEPTAFGASLTSPELLGAARDIAAQHQLWPSLVHMAAYAMTMAAYTHERIITAHSFLSLRESSPHMDVMTCMFSPTLVTVDLRDDPAFSEVLRRMAEQFTQAQEHSYVAHDEVVELLAQESARRGQPVRTESEWNFLNYAPRSCGARRLRFAFNQAPEAWAKSGSDTYFRVYEWTDGVTIALQAMSTVMDSATVERFLRGYEELIVSYGDLDLRVNEAVAMLEFDEPHQQRIVRVGSDRVNLGAVEAVLQSHPAVRSVTVDAGEGLVARVDAPGVSEAQLRTYFLDAMYDHQPSRCPTLSLSEPADPPVPKQTEAETALAEIVSHANELDALDLSQSYPSAGGRALLIPRVLTELRDHGWTGLTVKQLASARPMRALASRLIRTT